MLNKDLQNCFYERVITPYHEFLQKTEGKQEIIWREDEAKKLIRLLHLPDHNSVIVKGPNGIGKKSVVNAIIENQTKDWMPTEIASRQFYRLNVNVLFSSGTHQKVEAKLSEAINELKQLFQKRAIKPVLVIDDGNNFVNNIKSGPYTNLINILLDADVFINCVDIIMIVDEGSADSLKKSFPTFYDGFSEQNVEEPNEDTIREILSVRKRYYQQFNVTIPEEAIGKVLEITTKYPRIFEAGQPKRAMRLLDESAIAYKLKLHSKPKGIEQLEEKLKNAEENDEQDLIKETKAQIDTLYSEWHAGKEKIRLYRRKLSDYESLIHEDQVSIGKLNKKDQDSLDEKIRQYKEKHGPGSDDPLPMVQHLGDEDILKLLKIDTRIHQSPEIKQMKKDITAREKGMSECMDKIEEQSNLLNFEISLPEEFVEEVASQLTKLPIGGVGEAMEKRLLNGEETLNNTVLGQERMIKPIMNALKRAAAGGSNPNMPLGVFLILGPSGVGKTFIAKKIAKLLFGDENLLTEIRMENYALEQNISSLIGAPPGLVGYGEPGKLIKEAQEKPYSVVLLDEIEKAHEKVRQTLLTVFDEGKITGQDGESADFRNTVIIATSNFGQQTLLNNDLTMEEASEIITENIYNDPNAFAPEFLNRTKILFADFLSPEVIETIGKRALSQLESLYQIKNPGMTISIDDDSIKRLVDAEYERTQGARVIERIIRDEIGGHIATIILEKRAAGLEVNGEIKVIYDKEAGFTFEFTESKATETGDE